MAWRAPRKKKDFPSGLWIRCEGCERPTVRKAVEANLEVCPECGFHFEISAPKRIEVHLDPGSFEEIDADLLPADPLKFTARRPYVEKLAEDQRATGLKEAILTGRGRIRNLEIACGFMDPRFIRASMGSVVGEKFTRLVERAAEWRLPLIVFCASGGARMQEGILSLAQMAKTSAALGRYDDAGGLYIPVLTNPTTAGVMASFASLGDLIIAEPGALIGFTGPRVIQQTIKAELPKGFQRSEFLLEHGFLDRIVPRIRLKDELSLLLGYLWDYGVRAAAK